MAARSDFVFLPRQFNLIKPRLEYALVESNALRLLAGSNLGRESKTRLCEFRHCLERLGPGERIFARVGQLHQAKDF